MSNGRASAKDEGGTVFEFFFDVSVSSSYHSWIFGHEMLGANFAGPHNSCVPKPKPTAYIEIHIYN